VKQQKKESLVLGKMLQRIAPRIGATVLLEPEWGLAGQITFSSGKVSYFRYNTLDLNPVGSSDIAKDKDYANFFMKSMGYPVVPQSKVFFTDKWADAVGAPNRKIDNAYAYAQQIGFPVFVKPNSGSQGSDVALVLNKRQFYRAVKTIFTRDKIVLVQQPVYGRDYRVVVLDNKIISAYERIPLNVVGNGKNSIRQLLETKQRFFYRQKRDSKINFDNERMINKLHRQKLTLESVPGKGERVFLLDNANLSTGGDSLDVTNKINPQFVRLATSLTKQMGLRLCGVDLIIDGDIAESAAEGKYWILEINAAPGLDHYAKLGKEQEGIVEALYLQVLKSIENGNRPRESTSTGKHQPHR
jgi:D-alanine-D-alanine ligase-like ATP-grasp enzyme